MNRPALRGITGVLIALAFAGMTTGVANAADTAIWLLPGVDVGALLGPTVQLPTQLLAPVAELLGGIS